MSFIEDVVSPRRAVSLERNNKIKELLAKPLSFDKSLISETTPLKSESYNSQQRVYSSSKKQCRPRAKQHKVHVSYSSNKSCLSKKTINNTMKIHIPKREDYKVLYRIPQQVLRYLLNRYKKKPNHNH